MADVRKSYSKLSLEELLLQKEEIKRQKHAIKSEIKSRKQNQQLSHHGFLFTKALQPTTQDKVKQFLQFIIYGNQAETEKILINNPKIRRALLEQKIEVVDYSGRKILGTALQLALGAKDVRYHDDEICMVEMLKKYYNKLPDGEAVMAAQTREQFPDGWNEQEEARQEHDSAALHEIFHAIASSRNDQECDRALQVFIDHLERQTRSTIKYGYHFNDQLYIEAIKLYEQNDDYFGGWNSRKNNYFWQKVIGNIERYVPACEAQALCDGMYFIVKDKAKLTRSLTIRHDDKIQYFPLDSDPRFRLGHDCAAAGRTGPMSQGRYKWHEDYIRLKTARLRSFTSRLCELAPQSRAVM